MSNVALHGEQPLLPVASGVNNAFSNAAGAGVRSELPLFRFGLRQLFWFVTGFSTLLAVLASSSGVTSLVVMVVIAIVTAHVGSTALGSRLRAHADKTREYDAQQTILQGNQLQQLRFKPQVAEFLQCSSLHQRRVPYRRVPLWVTAGLILGAIVGGIVLALTTGRHISTAGVIVGVVSTAVMGGWLAFLGRNFYGIVRHVWDEAVAQQLQDEVCRAVRH